MEWTSSKRICVREILGSRMCSGLTVQNYHVWQNVDKHKSLILRFGQSCTYIKLKSNLTRKSFSTAEESSREDFVPSKNVNSGETTCTKTSYDIDKYSKKLRNWQIQQKKSSFINQLGQHLRTYERWPLKKVADPPHKRNVMSKKRTSKKHQNTRIREQWF